MGSKAKFWFRLPKTKKRWLFKYSRPRSKHAASDPSGESVDAVYSGEHWSEKIAAEVAGALGIAHADVELARHGRAPGVIVRDLTEDTQRGVLIHGNELLVEMDPSYPMTKQYRAREHTLDNILSALSQPFITLPTGPALPPALHEPCDLFVGYLLLDALIGNTDRHHENWAILVHRSGGAADAELAPSYDHASSLGRELTDTERERRLHTRDPGYSVDAYARRARSAIYLDSSSSKPSSTVEAFRAAATRYPGAAHLWLERLHGVSMSNIHDIVARVPDEVMSEPARAFSLRILKYNRGRLLATELA